MTTVYTKVPCEPCNATKRFLTKREIPFEEIPLTEVAPEQVAAWQGEGHLAAPIVVTADGRTWSGFRPDALATLA